jgi:type VI secretion system secreted protein Hcp
MTDDGAYKMFLLLDGIPGGSTAKGRKGWIDITGVDWGVEQAVAISGTGGGMTGVGSKQRRLWFTAGSGVASPLLFEASVAGKHVQTGTFEVQQGKSAVARWVFEDMLVTAFGSGTAEGADGLVDTFTLLARRLRYTTKATRGWDFLSKKALVAARVRPPEFAFSLAVAVVGPAGKAICLSGHRGTPWSRSGQHHRCSLRPEIYAAEKQFAGNCE